MYATGILLIVCGIPATLIFGFVFMGSEALLFGGYMIAAELVIAGVLLFVAEGITKRRHKI